MARHEHFINDHKRSERYAHRKSQHPLAAIKRPQTTEQKRGPAEASLHRDGGAVWRAQVEVGSCHAV